MVSFDAVECSNVVWIVAPAVFEDGDFGILGIILGVFLARYG